MGPQLHIIPQSLKTLQFSLQYYIVTINEEIVKQNQPLILNDDMIALELVPTDPMASLISKGVKKSDRGTITLPKPLPITPYAPITAAP